MDDDGFGVAIFWLLAGVGLFVWLGWQDDGWIGRMRYAWTYDVPSDNVEFASKPYDCDWSTAPIGAKHCSYAPVVTAYNAEEQAVVPDAIYVRNKETGELSVSYGWDGPLIKLPPGEPPDTKVKRVKVDWVKWRLRVPDDPFEQALAFAVVTNSSGVKLWPIPRNIEGRPSGV
jgi:hypothetical protein